MQPANRWMVPMFRMFLMVLIFGGGVGLVRGQTGVASTPMQSGSGGKLSANVRYIPFTALEETWRMYRRRDFDLMTVATNYPDEKAGVMKTLAAQHASGTNLLFASEDTYGMQAAFDAKWDGGVPFTMVIAPGGKVLYQVQGEVDILAMRRAIQANLENETYVGHPLYWANK